MKILVTGMTPQQCGNGTRHNYRAVVDLYVMALRYAGHEVVHREWTPGDDLTAYDAAIVGIVPFNSIAARHVYTITDVIARARQSGCGLVFMVDDWNFSQIRTSIRSLNKDTDRMFTTIKGRTHRDWAENGPGRPTLDLVMNALDTRPWPVVILPAYQWGDHSRFEGPALPTRELVCVDPTIFTDPYPFFGMPAEERKRAWVLGTLSNQLKWLEKLQPTWDVEYIGAKASKATRALKEDELVQLYAECWGVLSPPYRHAGSGWWRNRFVYAARTRAVLLADPEEVKPLGEPYAISPTSVEELSAGELAALADAQADELRRHMWSADQLVSVLERTLTDARNEARG